MEGNGIVVVGGGMSMGTDSTWVGKKPLRRIGGMSDALSIASDLGFSVAAAPTQVNPRLLFCLPCPILLLCSLRVRFSSTQFASHYHELNLLGYPLHFHILYLILGARLEKNSSLMMKRVGWYW